MDQLSTVAEVSKRTLYTHFPSKDGLVGAYLQSLVDDLLPVPLPSSAPTRSPREQLLAVFDWELPKTAAPFRGCPFLNASVEVPDPGHPAHQLAAAYKREFARRLTDIARQAGAADRKPSVSSWHCSSTARPHAAPHSTAAIPARARDPSRSRWSMPPSPTSARHPWDEGHRECSEPCLMSSRGAIRSRCG
ncbi:TetR/AcrR family transcriptional regulator [Streptomyces sp. GQFP]|uniref:TetR/AcrR family transcriptional regulator n=1 Tax=Streptomyces sp. GQFP TaxID=2907545 RepID=UPI003FA753C7